MFGFSSRFILLINGVGVGWIIGGVRYWKLFYFLGIFVLIVRCRYYGSNYKLLFGGNWCFSRLFSYYWLGYSYCYWYFYGIKRLGRGG